MKLHHTKEIKVFYSKKGGKLDPLLINLLGWGAAWSYCGSYGLKSYFHFLVINFLVVGPIIRKKNIHF